MKDNFARCVPCQQIQNGPKRFRVSFGADEVLFNGGVFIDVMYIDNHPVIHDVDDANRFSAAKFLPDVSTKQNLEYFC